MRRHLIFLWFVFAESVDSTSLKASVKKPTVCTITINSSEEKEVFQSYLAEDFNLREGVIETASGNIRTANPQEWFISACQAGVECDVLVVSGHFGGIFLAHQGYL